MDFIAYPKALYHPVTKRLTIVPTEAEEKRVRAEWTAEGAGEPPPAPKAPEVVKIASPVKRRGRPPKAAA